MRKHRGLNWYSEHTPETLTGAQHFQKYCGVSFVLARYLHEANILSWHQQQRLNQKKMLRLLFKKTSGERKFMTRHTSKGRECARWMEEICVWFQFENLPSHWTSIVGYLLSQFRTVSQVSAQYNAHETTEQCVDTRTMDTKGAPFVISFNKT